MQKLSTQYLIDFGVKNSQINLYRNWLQLCLSKHDNSVAKYLMEQIKNGNKMKHLRTFLDEQGIDQTSPKEAMETAKQTHRKLYMKEYHSAYKQKVKRASVTLSKDEYKQFEKAAKQHQAKVAPFIKACALAYIEEAFILPDDSIVRSIELGIRKIGNNINQVARNANTHEQLNKLDIEAIQNKLYELELLISNKLRKPDRLWDLLEKCISKNPSTLYQLEQFIQHQKQQLHDNQKYQMEKAA